ncbi:hypothetical protein LAZ67_5002097 [Cordylochernes scorpioides]|uniref:Transposase n=1 Tax=Cordylochernes scorpioides TaxID=51811 RepID=A0ABY6KG10_9ARAC|nr:hypothetical protein LAZ67_5002097 [Cordylochernes scorpioides]
MRRVAAKFVPKLLNCDQKQHRMNIANEMLDSVHDDPNLLQRIITGDEAGVVHHEFLLQGRTVNKEYYLQVMRNLREAIRQKRPDLWKNKNWLLHHDNAPAHTSLLVRDFLAKNNTLMMPQPPYSSDLAPCEFFLFPKLKRPMKGRRYATLDKIKTASKEELKRYKKKKDFLKCFEDWKNRWHKCIISHGDYFEGNKIDPPFSLNLLQLSPEKFPDGLERAIYDLGSNPRMPGHRKRRQFKQTDAFTRGMVIRLKRAGWSIRQIAADTHLGASTVHRLWRRWLEQGNVAIYRNVGATRVTSARVDRRILRQTVGAPQATCTAILKHVQDTLDHSISTRTISRRLVANGLHSCRPLRRLPLTPPNRRQRLEWCRARSRWMTEWHRVVFCLSSDSRRVRVWRRRGERSNPAAIVERPTVRQRGIIVWGAIAYDSRSPLLRIQGTMTAQRYVDDVLRPVTLPYLQGVPNDLYQQDNARPHTARISQQALQDVQMFPWPPYSPDLSPIEHVWDIIGRRLHALPQPRSEDELWQMVEREWRAIPQDAIRTLIDSLPRRVAACIAVRGGPTCY